MTIVIRPAQIEEASAIATLHADIWRNTYLDLAPAKALELLDAARRLSTWQTYLGSPKPRQHTLVAVNKEQVIGFIGFGPPSHSAFGERGEVKHLYVDPTYKRQGIGRRLLHTAFQHMSEDGFEDAALAVVRGNTNALTFYKAMGGVEVGGFTDAGPLWKSNNLLVAWDTISTS